MALILFAIGTSGAVIGFGYFDFDHGLGIASISVASTFGPAFAFVFKRKFSSREIKFTDRSKQK